MTEVWFDKKMILFKEHFRMVHCETSRKCLLNENIGFKTFVQIHKNIDIKL